MIKYVLSMPAELFEAQIEMAAFAVMEIFEVSPSNVEKEKFAKEYARVFTQEFLKANKLIPPSKQELN